MKATKPKYSTGWILFIAIWEVIALCALIIGSVYWYGQQKGGVSEGWSTIIRNLGLGAAGILGLPFLVWQTFQRDRTSKAQSAQAEASAKQAENTEKQVENTAGQVENVAVQIEATNKQLELTKEQLRITEQGQITERFTKAIEQLGDEKITVKLGGIYALERISNESEKDYWPIMDILADFVRQESAEVDVAAFEGLITQKEAATQKEEIEKLEKVINDWVFKNTNKADVLAAMKVMGRGKQKLRPEEDQHDVKGLDLKGVKIVGLDLTKLDYANAVANNAYFIEAKLESANFKSTDLSHTNFFNANLLRANLSEANLDGANLGGAKLRAANLEGADLEGANLVKANLRGANLRGANLRGANLELVVVERKDWFGYLAQLEEPPLGLKELQQKYWIDPDKPQKTKPVTRFIALN